MKKLFAALKRAPKRTGLVAVAAAAVIVPASLYAWGPDRPTYTLENPADHVTFNSITNNAKHGDERNFVQIREAGTGTYGEEVQVTPGKEYEVYVFYHNNASTTLNDEAHNYAGVAKNAQMRVQMPDHIKAGEKARVTGFVSADNAQPKSVWDEAYAASSSDVALRYVQDSAKITNLGATNGATLSNDLLKGGVPLGFDSLNGDLPGCNHYSGYVIFRFKAVQPDFEITKQVSPAGQNNFNKNITVNADDTVDYKIKYQNTGSVQQDNVTIKDTLPAGVDYIPGTTKISNSETSNQWADVKEETVTTDGINIGSYAPEAAAYVKFSAKITDNDKLPVCGINTLTNKAEAITENGTKEDTADVTVNKDCDEPAPVYTCDALAVSKVGDNKYKFESGYTVEGGTFKSVKYEVRDANGNLIDTVAGAPNAAEYTQSKPGKYSVQAIVTFTVDGKDVTAGGDACKKAFEVPTPEEKEIQVCNLEDNTIITIKEDEYDSSKHSMNLSDCEKKPIEVCDITTGEIVTIDSSDYDSNKHSTTLSDCATPETPVTPGNPETPTELPQTGSTGGMLTLASIATITLAIGYAVTTRRA